MTGYKSKAGKGWTVKYVDGKAVMVPKKTFRRDIAARKSANKVRRFVRGKPLL